MQEYAVSTPRNVFLYGRGGQENISCSFRFTGSDNQRIQIKFSNISMGSSSSCKTVFDASLNQFRCERSSGETGVFVSEVMSEPWSQQQCHCQVMSRSGQVMTSVSNNILGMSHLLQLNYSFKIYKLDCMDYMVYRNL